MSSENQPLRPLNDVVLAEETTQVTEEEMTNAIDLNLCQWRYPKEVINRFNDYQTSVGKNCKIPYRWTKWQEPNQISY